ncbi:hypothetical protein [Streptomyces sp. NPDC058424]|uniref:hypothetical protein n=1 Tax=Streptomyces sp. NPDC058424 TaxID=3346491 RepID=UPI0036558E83
MTSRTVFFDGAYFEAPEGLSVEEWLSAVEADPRTDDGMKEWAGKLAAAFRDAGVE